MTLRLAGEEFSVVLGLDGQGYLREVLANDTDPRLKVNQQGSGPIADLQDGGTSVFQVLDGGEVTVRLGDATGAKKLLIKDSGGAIVATINSDGKVRFGDAAAPGGPR